MRFRGKGELTFGRPVIMGILNVTPDSFSDGGSYFGAGAVEHALEMISQGADIIDIGGESTRPGSDPVPASEEMSRVVPVVRELAQMTDVPISVDTMKPEVAEAVLEAGADMINDVGGLRSEAMMEVVGRYGVPAVIMHMKGVPKTMQDDLKEGSILDEVRGFLSERVGAARDHGIRELMTDPGVGFGKTVSQNLELIDNSSEFSLGCPVLIGASRKRFLSEVYPGEDPDTATAKICARAVKAGANVLRVHNVAAVRGI